MLLQASYNLSTVLLGLPRLLTRVRRVGGLSLAALIVGGTILILFAANVLNTKSSSFDDEPSDKSQAVFGVGSQLSPQAWLAVLGVGFGLLSYNFTETYAHVFDTWCSWQASRNKGLGLDYARYLNSMPRVPIMLGLCQGFSVFVLCRYIIMTLGITASVGYKFAVIEGTVETREQLPPLRGLEMERQAPGSVTPRCWRPIEHFSINRPSLPDNLVTIRATPCAHHSPSLWSAGQTTAVSFMSLTRGG
jgi:hypothetical protein